MDKIEIIKEIVKHHPGWGTDGGYSWYEGGMRDTGGWNWDKLIDMRENELQILLNKLNKQKKENDEWNRKNLEEYDRIQKLPKEKQDEYYKEQKTKIEKEWEDYYNQMERRLLWGK